jgi:hypothetical protein
VLDSGASSHIAAHPGMVTPSNSPVFPSSIIVGNGATLPVLGTGYSSPLARSTSTMFSLLLPSSKTSSLFANSPLTTPFQLNLTLLVFL